MTWKDDFGVKGIVVWESKNVKTTKHTFNNTRHEVLLTKYGVETLLNEEMIIPIDTENPHKVYEPKNMKNWLKFVYKQKALI
jgi:hypothetical protein